MVNEKDAWGAVPPGTWIDRFVRMVEERTDAPVGFAVGAAYAAASLLVHPDMHIQYGAPVHGQQFVCLIGASGDSRKTVVVGYGRRVVSAWDSSMVLPEPESEGGLAESMRDQPQALLPLPEMGAFLTGTKKGSHKDGLRSRLTALWDGDPFGRRTVKDPFEIEAPRLSVLGGVAPSFLEETMTAHDFDGGFLNRFLIIYADRERDFPIPPMLDAVDLHKEWGALQAQAMTWSPCIGWTDDGEAFFKDWKAYCTRRWGGNPRMLGFIARTAPLVLKAAMALSIVMGVSTQGKGWELDSDVLEYACWLGKMHLQSVETLLAGLSMGTFSRLRREILTIVLHRKSGATLAQILAGLAAGGEARKLRDVEDVLKTLCAEDTLEVNAMTGKKTRYVRYTEEVEI